MHILLDTNIYLADLTLSKPEYEALANYLGTANSMLLIPNMVRREVEKKIASTAASEAAGMAKSYSGRLGILPKLPTEDAIETTIKNNFDKSLINFRRASIDYKGIGINELVERSLSEIPPFQSRGRGFRDALIWHSLLTYLKENPKATVALITKNTKDFGAGRLKPELIDELAGLGYAKRVFYFNELSDFLNKHGQPIAFIDDDFITTNVRETANEYGESHADEDELEIDYPNRDFDWRASLIEYDNFQVENYYIFRTTETQYHVSVDVTLIYSVDLEGSRMEWGFNPNADEDEDDFDWYPEYVEEFTGGFRDIEILLTINKKERTIESVVVF